MAMRTVYIDFTRSRKPLPLFSWAIQLFEQAPYSHVRLHWRSSWFDWTTFEASGSEVKLIGSVGLANHPVTVVHRYELELNPDQYKKMIQMLRYAGVKYGVKQVIGMALQRVFGLKKNPFGDRYYSMVCSELIAYFFSEVLFLNPGWDTDAIGPRKIKEWLDDHPGLSTKIK